MKRMPAVLAAVLFFGLTGCSSAAPATSSSTPPVPTSAAPDSPTAAPAVVDAGRVGVALHGLGHVVGAESTLQVIVDIGPYVTDIIVNSSTLFVAVGSVEASVDFAALPANAVQVSTTVVAITMPVPTLGAATIDVDKSYLYDAQRGLVSHVGELIASASDQQALYKGASGKLTTAAQSSGLLVRAEANLRSLVTVLMRGFGYPTVTVTFAA